MASASTKAADTKLILKPVTTLKGHEKWISSISYFPDGQRIISGSDDKTARQWDLKLGKQVEEARDVCEKEVCAVAVSRDGRWVVTAGGDGDTGTLKACEVETGIVKKFKGHSSMITCIDISTDGTMLASGAWDFIVRIWNFETGKLVAVPLKTANWVGAVRLSTDSKKLAVNSWTGMCLDVWDVRTRKLDVRIGEFGGSRFTFAPMFWTNKNKNILATFTFTRTQDDPAKTIYEFDALTLETVGTPFEGHTDLVTGLALSFDCALLASSSDDNTIKLWAFESRQILATFDVKNPVSLVLSPDSRQFAYPTYHEIHICNIPPDVLAQARTSARKKSNISVLLNPEATCRPPTVRRRQPIPIIPISQRPPPPVAPKKSILIRLSNFFRFSPGTNALPTVRNNQPRDPLDFPATSPLPHPLSWHTTT